MQSFQAKRRVEFADTDMAGIVHFSSFFRYMEETEYAFLRSLGFSVVMRDEKGMIGMPRREAKCEFHRPAHFEDVLTIDLSVTKNDGLRMEYSFRILHEEQLIANGKLLVVCCRFSQDRAPYAIPFPDHVIESIPLRTTRSNDQELHHE
jgi:YbgC/YbaW family acyl-CoA thioester hydrolase